MVKYRINLSEIYTKALTDSNNVEVDGLEIASIIKYEGDNSTFVWKHPCEDFNTTTQLIVHESQEAIIRISICFPILRFDSAP